MTIQLSVTVWTVICFVLLMVILHNLLFKPILELLDKRNKKIEDAKCKKAEYESVQSEYESLLKEKRRSALEIRLNNSKEEIEKIRANSKLATQKAQEERIKMVDSYRLKVYAEQREILADLEAHSESLAFEFAESLVKG